MSQLFFTLFCAVSLSQNCTAAFSWDHTDLTIQFTDLSTSQNGNIVSWFWDFDDGTTSTEQNPRHTFSEVDKYDVELEIMDDQGCINDIKIRIEICVLNIEYSVGDCDPDNNLPIVITVYDVYDNADEIEIFIDGVLLPGGPFDIAENEPVTISSEIPGDGLEHTITVISDDIETCVSEVSFFVEDCSSDCFLSAMSTGIENTGSRTVLVGGNFFNPVNTNLEIGETVIFQWIDGGHSTTSDATSGPDSWNSGVISGPTYEVDLLNPGIHPYYCSPHGGPGGSGMSGTLIADCPMGDLFNVIVSFNTSIADPQGFRIYLDGSEVPGSPFDYDGTGPQSETIQVIGDGLIHDIMVEDVNDPSCTLEKTFTSPDCGASPSCQLTLSGTIIGVCDANDNVKVEFTIDVIQPEGNNFNVFVNGTLETTVPYDPSGTIIVVVDVPGNGNSNSISVEDEMNADCIDEISITTPDCSLPCEITNLEAIPASGGGGPSGIVHTVLVEDFVFNPAGISISAGDIVTWEWVGDVAHTATSDATSGPDSWDSGLLNNGDTYDSPILSEGVHPYYCIPHGAQGGVGMAGSIEVLPPCNAAGEISVQVSFNVASPGAQGFEILVDGAVVDVFDYSPSNPQVVSILSPGDGQSYSLGVRDVQDNDCNSFVNVDLPNCSGDCNLDLTGSVQGGCLANQNVLTELSISASNAGSSFNLFLDGSLYGNYNYSGNPTIVEIEVPGDGQAHTVEVVDADDPDCSDQISITTPDCSLPCEITELEAIPASGGGGPSGIVHTVLVEDFVYNPADISISAGDFVTWEWVGNVAHTATSDATSGPDSWDSGLLNNGDTYDSPILSEGVHPYYCTPHGAQGGVGMAGTIEVLPPCNASGEISVQVSFNVTSPGAQGFEILVDGAVVDVFDYSPSNPQVVSILSPGDGQSHTLEVRDVQDNDCNSSVNVDLPNCSGDCNLDLTGSVQGGCLANQNVITELSISASNAGSSFDLFLDGSLYGNYDYSGNPTVVEIEVPGDGQAHTVEVVDDDDPDCSDQISITTPDCNLPCEISELEAIPASGGGGPSGIVHTVLVEDFVFNPADISISAGDIVTWEWVGNVAHTATSDATSGPDSWDSGLLNNGDTYDSPILSEGVHPYYCTPHGAQGGVGMAGTIEVLPPCNASGEISVQVSFNVASPGAQGFEILVDGAVVDVFDYSPSNPQVVSILSPGDGQSHTLEVRDVQDNDCNSSVNVDLPNCSGDCNLDLTGSVQGGCLANQNVLTELSISASNAGASFDLFLDGSLYGNYNYSGNPTIVEIEVPGDGQAHTVEVVDANDPDCSDQISITTPDCSLPCDLYDLEVSFGQNTKHNIEVLDFDFSPKNLSINLGDTIEFIWIGQIPHTATSDQSSGPNSFQSGLLAQGATYTFIPGEPGELPYYCVPHGAPGGIGMAGSIEVFSNCENGLATASISFSRAGTSAAYNIFVDDSLFNSDPIPYQSGEQQFQSIQIPGDGSTVTVEIKDQFIDTCAVEKEVILPNCDEDEICQINIADYEIGDCVDDQFELSIEIENLHTSEYFRVIVDGSVVDDSIPFHAQGTTLHQILLTGNNSIREIKIQDIETLNCSDEIDILAPDCGPPCFILTISENKPGKKKILVRDFDFSPKDAEVFVGDTIEFIWVGEIPHTTTSDALSGPNSWDSGLLTQGDTFLLVIKETGQFPYYCIPHGGPGGIGMTGTISVQDTCNGDFWLTELIFEVTNGSPLGYNYFVDGIKQNNNPIPYQDRKGLNSLMIELPGDGNIHLVTIQDLETGFCAATAFIESSICGAGCGIIDLSVNSGRENIHYVEVRDFDYLPEKVTIRAGETVKFNFTGSIPHTVTSDLLSGADAFDSGLLSQGDSFSVTIQNPGDHPYYCIPHGGPGGLGMAGNIKTLPTCNNGNISLGIEFWVTNGSSEGYNVFIDGDLHPSSPFQYQNPIGFNRIEVELEGDGETHIITVQDLENPICAASAFAEIENCSATCDFSNMVVDLAGPGLHRVEVRDFDFMPKTLSTIVADTIFFDWVGVVPHTVTSDNQQSDFSFNSGLLGQGSEFYITLDSAGDYPYYCIPHGAPGGIGMAGNIQVFDLCHNDSLLMTGSFLSSSSSGSYRAFVNGIELSSSPFSFKTGGEQHFDFKIPGNGQVFTVSIEDSNAPDCNIEQTFTAPNCNDPCFRLVPGFDSEKLLQELTVQFYDRSRDAVQWEWDFGDGFSSAEKNPVRTFAEEGTYEVCLTVYNGQGCQKTICDRITLGGVQCIVDFDLESDGLTINLTNKSVISDNQVSFIWEISDGSVYNQTDLIEHTFDDLGVYEICLKAESENCTNSKCITVNLSNPCILLKPNFSFERDEDDHRTIDFSEDVSGNFTNILWGFGDGSTSNDLNPSHTYDSDGIYTVCLLVQDAATNCTKSLCIDIEIGVTNTVDPGPNHRNFMVYPNPAFPNNDIMLVGFHGADINHHANYTIFNSIGETVDAGIFKLSDTQIYSGQLRPGVYFMIINGKRYNYLGKIMIVD